MFPCSTVTVRQPADVRASLFRLCYVRITLQPVVSRHYHYTFFAARWQLMHTIGLKHLLLVHLWATASVLSGAAEGENDNKTPQELVDECRAWQDLQNNIADDLATWAGKGITLEVMQSTIEHHTTRKMGQKGLAAGFQGGVAYLVDKPVFQGWVGQHVALFIIYMKVLLDLQHKFGQLIPDVEFVISTLDRPVVIATDPNATHEPVFRFCKTSSHSDILIPIFHFYMKNYSANLLDNTRAINKRYLWADKKPTLFGRFSPYLRHIHVNDTYAQRQGANGTSICKQTTQATVMCTVREHFEAWAQSRKPQIDVGNGRQVPMVEHAQYKYLAHLDGQGLSSRLDSLLPLNSLIFKEESGYRAFYHKLLKPYQHYIPFWKQRPEEILDALKWAEDHDEEAQQIASNAQQFAVKYLNHNSRQCYWYRLLVEYAKLLKYKPGKTPGRQYMQYYMPVSEFLDTVAKTYDGGKWYDRYPFTP